MFYEAIYEPSKTAHLNGESKKFIGKRIALQVGWRLKDGPYKGQHCFIPSSNFGWIPTCDLKDIKNISYGRWKDIHNSFSNIRAG